MTHTTNLGASTPLPEGGKSLRIQINRNCNSPLRGLPQSGYWQPLDVTKWSHPLPISEVFIERKVEHSAAVAGAGTLAHILLEVLVVGSVKPFYDRTTFTKADSPDHMTFQSFEADVLWRHKDEFDACLLYLRDFMQVIDKNDVQTIQDFETQYSQTAQHLRNNISALNFDLLGDKLVRIDRAVFKLSNHRLYVEIGADPEFKEIDWETQKGNEYVLFEGAINAIRLLEPPRSDA